MAGDHQDDSVRDQAIRIDVNAAQTVEWETEGLNLEDQANSSNVQQWQQQLWANPPPLFTDVGITTQQEKIHTKQDDCFNKPWFPSNPPIVFQDFMCHRYTVFSSN
ncbi:hypothetical protein V6N13_007917 [Hibiscus sabdariffa]